MLPKVTFSHCLPQVECDNEFHFVELPHVSTARHTVDDCEVTFLEYMSGPMQKLLNDAGIHPFKGTLQDGREVEFYLINKQGHIIGVKKEE